MNATPLFSVVIPVLNNWTLSANCLRSLRAHTPEHDFEVIVVDNASGDETKEALPSLGRALFGARFSLIRFEENRNFGPASNAGARAATAPLLFFLNNDTLLTPGWAGPLLAALGSPYAPSPAGGATAKTADAAGPLLLYADDTVQHLGVAFNLSAIRHLHQGIPAAHPLAGKSRFFQVLSAAALLMPKDFFFQAGAFHEEYRNGFEDVDLCLQLGRLGKKLACVPGSRVYHLESRSRSGNEAGNGEILHRRCRNLARPDMHEHALRDGLDVFINDSWEISLRMKAADEAALMSRAEGRPAEVWAGLLRENPFWVSGRERFADLLEQNGHFGPAARAQCEACALLQRVEAYGRLSRLAARADDALLAGSAEERLRQLGAWRSDREKARRLYQTARETGSGFLRKVFEERMAEVFHERIAP